MKPRGSRLLPPGQRAPQRGMTLIEVLVGIAIGLVGMLVMFQTLSVWPTSISRAAIAAPMRPNPAIPICMRFPR